jgi:hypothetical protein
MFQSKAAACLLAVLAVCAAAHGQTKDEFPFAELTPDELAALKGLDEHCRAYAVARLAGAYTLQRLSPDHHVEWRTGQVGFLADGNRPFVARVSQVVDGQNMLVYGSKLWVEGIDTSELTDSSDAQVNLSGTLFLVAGTKTYDTALGGSRTVKHLVAVNGERPHAVIRRIVEARGYRLWSDREGGTIIAEFARKSGSKVTLRLPGGKTLAVVTKALSDEDQEWVKQRR